MDLGADGGEERFPILSVFFLAVEGMPSSWRLHSGLGTRGLVFNFSSFDGLKIPHCSYQSEIISSETRDHLLCSPYSVELPLGSRGRTE